jgi:ATP-dependent helicase/nuclease subunit A
MTPRASSAETPSRALVDAEARESIRTALDDTFAVEAAAGTGKTSVLVDRIVNILAQGRTTVDRIVAVTFTEKAAGELKLRLRACLETERSRTPSASVHRHLDAALANLEQAHVSTIHGFCADLLRERPVEARLDPQFTTLTESQAERLYGEVFRDWLQRQLEQPPEGVRRALRRSSFDAENGPVKRLERAGWTLVEWRDFSTPWRRDPFDRRTAIDACVRELETFCALTQEPGDKKDPIFEGTRDARRLLQELTLAERVRPRDYDGLEARAIDLGSWRFKNINTGRKTSPYRNGVSRMDVVSAHQRMVAQLEQFQRAADADLAALLQAELHDTVTRYQVAKARLGALDFLDLLICARDLVRDHDGVRAAFQHRFTHLFIDEFQDTDPLQAELLLLLSADDPLARRWRDVRPRRGKLFLVGDPKQSIYRFRRADVGIYRQVRDQLTRHGARCVELTTSFRATPTIQHVVNAGFAPVMRGDAAARQATYMALSPARADAAGQPSVVALPVPRPYGDRGYVTKVAINASLPDAVGAFVDWLVTRSGWTVTERENPNQRVPVQARHVCLLFRRFDTRVYGPGGSWMEDVTRPYVQALEARGVPHVLVGGKSFHEREEVEAMRTALTAIEWPDDEIAVFGALRGALFSITDEALFEYRRLARRVQPFVRPQEPVPAHLHPLVEALDILRELHVRRNYRPVPETIARLLDVSRAHVAFALRPSGEQALANVQFIAELARQYESNGGISFRGFVEQLQGEAASTRSAEAPILEEGSDGVRIMTAHKAKGLEFPVVILADMTAELSRRSASRWADSESGRCAVSLAGWVPADLRDHEAEEIARDEAEGVRVAYVAATRARDLLVIPAIGDRPQEGWIGPLNAAIYPPVDRCREQDAGPGCPPFGKDSVLDREATIPFTSVCPGLHTFDIAMPPSNAGSSFAAAFSTVASAGAHGSADTHADAHDDAAAASYPVVWWDPAILDLGRAPNYGLRREELIAKDAPLRIVQQGMERYHAWRVAREGAIERGSVPSLRVVTVRARAAAGIGDAAAGDAAAGDTGAADAAAGAAAHDAPVSVVSLHVDQARPSGTRFGALVHAVLGLVPLDASATDVRRLAEQQVRVLGASESERDAVVPLVAAALQHDLFARARQAQRRGRLRRETPLAFVDDQGFMVEGVVDLAFEEDDGWIVVDFKTDQEIETGQLQTYLRQVALYAAAIRRATGRPSTGILLRL